MLNPFYQILAEQKTSKVKKVMGKRFCFKTFDENGTTYVQAYVLDYLNRKVQVYILLRGRSHRLFRYCYEIEHSFYTARSLYANMINELLDLLKYPIVLIKDNAKAYEYVKDIVIDLNYIAKWWIINKHNDCYAFDASNYESVDIQGKGEYGLAFSKDYPLFDTNKLVIEIDYTDPCEIMYSPERITKAQYRKGVSHE